MKKTINNHPYVVTTVIFLVIFLGGMVYYQLNREALAFLLLLYLMAAVGIRLDNITRRLESIEITCKKVLHAEEDTRRGIVETTAAIRRLYGRLETISPDRLPDSRPTDGSCQEMD